MKLIKTLLLGLSMLAMTACGNTETIRPTFYVNEDGHLIEVYNGNETDLGLVKGQDGKDGTNGQNGRDGKDGLDGKDGVNGQDGKDGRDGVDGKDGLNGQDGKDGIDGKDGADGKDGQDGRDGTDGKDGRDGVDGKDGQDGKDGEVVVVERYNEYWENLCEALSNASYVDDSDYSLEEGHTFNSLAVYVAGKSGSKNCVVGYHSLGATEGTMHMWGLEYSNAHWTDRHTQYCCIKREEGIDYTEYLPKPLYEFDSYYGGEVHHEKVFGPSETYEHTLTGMGLNILVNAKVECWSSDTAINYNGVPACRVVISYEDSYCIGEVSGILEDIRVQNRKINPKDYSIPWNNLTIGETYTAFMSLSVAYSGYQPSSVYMGSDYIKAPDYNIANLNGYRLLTFKLLNDTTKADSNNYIRHTYTIEVITNTEVYTIYDQSASTSQVPGEYYIHK